MELKEMDKIGSAFVALNPTPAERDAIFSHYGVLKAAKHAVIADEIQHGDGLIEVKIHHYLTCTACVGAR